MNIKKFELGWKYNERSILAKGTKEELKILQEAVYKGVGTPYTYNRLSILLSKERKIKEAVDVCEKYQKIMNKRLEFRKKKGYTEDISSTEKNIIKRLNNLQSKLK